MGGEVFQPPKREVSHGISHMRSYIHFRRNASATYLPAPRTPARLNLVAVFYNNENEKGRE